MRALLVTNPTATATSPRVRDVIINALSSHTCLEVAHTDHRGHAIELGAQAAAGGVDLVIALGGDGTVNELVNGMLRHGPRADLPALAALPGGSANVFARTLGISNDPVEATSQLLEAIEAGRSRRIGLGLMEGRWFVFTAGLGFDAAVVHAVELHRGGGRRASPTLYARTAVRDYLLGTQRRRTHLRVSTPAGVLTEDAFMCVVTNTTPWTYYKKTAVQVTPQASYETGLDVFTLDRVGPVGVGRLLWQITRPEPRPRGRKVAVAHDLDWIEISSDDPVPVQVDGDYAGDFRSVRLSGVRDALRVVC